MPIESEEIIIRYYLDPVPVMVDPGKNYPNNERDLLLGWICEGKGRRPVLKKFPNAKLMNKIVDKPKPYLTLVQQ